MTLEEYQNARIYNLFQVYLDNSNTIIEHDNSDYVALEEHDQHIETPFSTHSTVLSNVIEIKTLYGKVIETIQKATSNDINRLEEPYARWNAINDVITSFERNARDVHGYNGLKRINNARLAIYGLIDKLNEANSDNPYDIKLSNFVTCTADSSTRFLEALNNCELFYDRPDTTTTYHPINSAEYSHVSKENYNRLHHLSSYLNWVIQVYEKCGVLPLFYNIIVSHQDDCHYLESSNTYYPSDSDSIVWSECYHEYLLRDDCSYVESRQDWFPSEETHYCEECGEYIHEEDECDSCHSNVTDSENQINDYHDSPNPVFKGKLETLDKEYLSKVRDIERFSIGFEIEKTEVNYHTKMGERVDTQPFFAGWETDSSCGVEGISHVYSLDDYMHIATDIDNSPYIDEDTDIKCGGHINISDFSDKLSYWHISPFMGLFYALWRYRLKRDYCGNNKKLNPYHNNTHYNVIAEKHKNSVRLFELRIPNAVKNRPQLKLRYQLMQNFMTCVNSYMQEDFSYMTAIYDYEEYYCPDRKINILVKDLLQSEYFYNSDLLMQIDTPTYQRCRYVIEKTYPILREMYKNNESSIPTIIMLTYAFQTWLDGNNRTEPTTSIRQYIHN